MKFFKVLACLLFAPAWSLAQSSALEAAQSEFFEQKVRPVLVGKCYSCHTDSGLGGLQMDSRAALLKGGNSGAALIPGKPAESLFIQTMNGTHPRLKMPMGGKLSAQEVTDLTKWVSDGAFWPEEKTATGERVAAIVAPGNGKSGAYSISRSQRSFWAYQPLHSPAIPEVQKSGWAQTPIDRLILQRLAANGVSPAPAADKRTLLRRVTFDLIGLPPTPAEVDAFLADNSPQAFAKVVDRLLSSPHYGERWGRHWLDLARYVDVDKYPGQDIAENAWRYRDWVIEAFNHDLPYDQFVKAQIAADFLPAAERKQHLPALGFQSLARTANDQVDVTSKVFLGLTVSCAQCHNHKYDPIPTQDYYSLLGVFRSSQRHEEPLVDTATVAAWKKQQSLIDAQLERLREFQKRQSDQLSELFAARTADYLQAAWQILGAPKRQVAEVATTHQLDQEVLQRLVNYLPTSVKDHPYLNGWKALLQPDVQLDTVQKFAAEFAAALQAILAERKAIEERNFVKLGGSVGLKDAQKVQFTNLEFLAIEKYYLWRVFCSPPYKMEGVQFEGGVFYFGEKNIGRFLSPLVNAHMAAQQAELAVLKKALPPRYPFLNVIAEGEKIENVRIAIRGDENNLGEEAPRRFLQILCPEEPAPFAKEKSGRWELASAIAAPANPLTARVMVNRIWRWHFGQGIVRTPSNFGVTGERPDQPELLEYLARRFIESKWSMKALHREILLSSAYQMSSEFDAAKHERDPENRWLWRFHLQPRLEVEAVRDAILVASGMLDPTIGGPSSQWQDDFRRRTMYVELDREEINHTLKLFDFPEASLTSEQRSTTNGPLQRLFFLNSPFVIKQAALIAARLAPLSADTARVQAAYQLLFNRPAQSDDLQLGLQFLEASGADREKAWAQYVQALLNTNEFTSVR